MAQSFASAFADDTAALGREAEVPNANWNSGMLGGGGAGPGIGISTENPGLDESLPNWTLLDQFGNARAGQVGQNIGGLGFVDRGSVPWPSSGGNEGTAPDSTIVVLDPAGFPTYAEKLDGSKLDGELPSGPDATLTDLSAGWQAGA